MAEGSLGWPSALSGHFRRVYRASCNHTHTSLLEGQRFSTAPRPGQAATERLKEATRPRSDSRFKAVRTTEE